MKLFYAYSHRDEQLRDELEKHLSLLKRKKLLTEWHDRKIGPGEEWEGSIDSHLNSSQIVLLLVSSDFLASDYCYDVEVSRAMELHESGDAKVIPVILRAVDWSLAPFRKLLALPTDGRPVTSWPNRDEAFTDIAIGIRRIIEGAADAQVAKQLPGDRLGGRYELIDLGTLGGDASWPRAINDAGLIVGVSRTKDGNSHAFLHDRKNIIDIGALLTGNSSAFDINASAKVSGTNLIFSSPAGPQHSLAYVYSNGVAKNLGTLGGRESHGLGINIAGQVVGTSHRTNGTGGAFLFSGNSMTDLGGLPGGGENSGASQINDHGMIVGSAQVSHEGEHHAVIWHDGAVIDLGTLGGASSNALDINNLGMVVGHSVNVKGQNRAFLYVEKLMRDLGALDETGSLANGINDHGIAVGRSWRSDSSGHRAVMFSAGQVVDLNDLISDLKGCVLEEATDINTRGEIIAVGRKEGLPRAFVLVP